MKLNNKYTKRKAGMTLLELTVVILVLLSLITILFVGARAWKRGSDRSANIMNIRNCQQAMRGEQNMKQMVEGAAFLQADLEEFMKYPAQVNATIGAYTNTGDITPESANPATTWDHIWLIPGDPGLPDDIATAPGFGHTAVADTTGW